MLKQQTKYYIDEYLKTYNFIRVETKMTDSCWGDAFYVKNK